ncbi:MAG: lipid A deacylase LpxR family protein [Deltaproteobacteria bacterium]|nr:lipid A deacylase LpxR family protein [Candidatus Anaeroferrophillus wilburensis]MBN2888039.1 lipid A deacylase LpxR family protein [Deltaproteobacteria bacterium]
MTQRLVLSLLFFALLIPADSRAAELNPWIHSCYFENDLFTGTDSNYTNGVKYAIISPDLSPTVQDKGRIPKKVLDLIHTLPFIRNAPPETAHKVEFSFGQNIYTPADIARSDLIDDDRPYAGWTYLGTAYHRKSVLQQGIATMDTVEIQLGLVGPESYAENSQKLVHELRDLQTPNGWDHQLHNEPGIVLAFERKWLFHPHKDGLGWATIGHTGGTLGNVATYLNGGLEVRLGWNIPENFGVSLIRPAGSTRMGVTCRPSFYLLGALDSRLVFRDIFLDGNTFTDSHSVDKEPLVADLAAGVACSYGRFMLTFTQVLRTKEFKKQTDSHSFGAISLSCFFNF